MDNQKEKAPLDTEDNITDATGNERKQGSDEPNKTDVDDGRSGYGAYLDPREDNAGKHHEGHYKRDSSDPMADKEDAD